MSDTNQVSHRTQEIVFVAEESPEGGFEARALSHSIFTEADTIDELKRMIQEAVRCHFDDDAVPLTIRLHLSGVR
ncbi:MAG: 2-oxoisovalerate dehydrogenase [Candidatus Poribacteria bacterium]|nr:2-oxoisovalerate dehydrogenase [Candidatus Poribacteria bacterium]